MTAQTECSACYRTENPLQRVWHAIVTWSTHRRDLARNRREVRRMLDLDASLLEDIGLEREDIVWALSSPSDVLPGERLQILRAERVRNRVRSALRHRR